MKQGFQRDIAKLARNLNIVLGEDMYTLERIGTMPLTLRFPRCLHGFLPSVIDKAKRARWLLDKSVNLLERQLKCNRYSDFFKEKDELAVPIQAPPPPQVNLSHDASTSKANTCQADDVVENSPPMSNNDKEVPAENQLQVVVRTGRPATSEVSEPEIPSQNCNIAVNPKVQ